MSIIPTPAKELAHLFAAENLIILNVSIILVPAKELEKLLLCVVNLC